MADTQIQLALPVVPAYMPAVPVKTLPIETAQTEYFGCSGIYFFWDNARNCAYVGKSKNVGQRIANHEKFNNAYVISVLLLPAAEIHFAELYYIWLLRPYTNKEGLQTAEDRAKTNDVQLVFPQVIHTTIPQRAQRRQTRRKDKIAAERNLVSKICSTYKTRGDRMREWRAKTGKGQSAFYRRLDELATISNVGDLKIDLHAMT